MLGCKTSSDLWELALTAILLSAMLKALEKNEVQISHKDREQKYYKVVIIVLYCAILRLNISKW